MPTAASDAGDAAVQARIAAIEPEARRADAEALSALMRRATGWSPRLWGANIIGFGRYAYRYDSGHAGAAPVVGFAPRRSDFSLYLAQDLPDRAERLSALGRHTSGVGCVYVRRLSDVDLAALEALAAASAAFTRSRWPVAPA